MCVPRSRHCWMLIVNNFLNFFLFFKNSFPIFVIGYDF